MKTVTSYLTAICIATVASGVAVASSHAASATGNDARGEAAIERIAAQAAAELNRDATVSAIVVTLRQEAETRGYVGWEKELGDLLTNAPIQRLLDAQARADAGADYQSVVWAALGSQPKSVPQLSGAAVAFSSSSAGGVTAVDSASAGFRAIAPCRIVDTRLATGGALSATSIRPFHIDDSAAAGTIASQGGDCTLTAPPGTIGVVINLTATQQAERGFMTVFPFDEAFPAAGSSINYTPGTNLANTTTVGTAVATGADFNIYTLRNVHAVVDLLGYFVLPDKLPVSTLQADVSGAFDIDAACPAGYSYVSAEHDWAFGNTDVWFWKVGKDASTEAANCVGFVDRGSFTSDITCTAICER